jgi:tetratricopeptide (TPR) repeat protein
VLIDPKAIDFFTNEVILVQINGDVDSITKNKYNVMGYPTFILVDKDGKEVDRLPGYQPTDEYIQTFRDYAKGIGTLDDLLKKSTEKKTRDGSFAIAEKYKWRGNETEARSWYTQVISMGDAKDSLSGETRLALADMSMRKKDYTAAISAYSEIVTDFAGKSFAETADIYIPITYRRMGDTTKAITAFEEFIKKYPKSEDVEYAQKQISKLKGETPAEKK